MLRDALPGLPLRFLFAIKWNRLSPCAAIAGNSSPFYEGLATKKTGSTACDFVQFSERIMATWLETLTQNAEHGDAEAQCELGEAYLLGRNLTQDVNRGIELLRQSAASGSAKGQYLLGRCYLKGQGVVQNQERAAELFSTSAAQGNGMGQFYYGLMLKRNNASEYSIQAAKWFELAANQDVREAQFELGLCFENGLGVERSIERAAHWYKHAALHGLDRSESSFDPGHQTAESSDDTVTNAKVVAAVRFIGECARFLDQETLRQWQAVVNQRGIEQILSNEPNLNLFQKVVKMLDSVESAKIAFYRKKLKWHLPVRGVDSKYSDLIHRVRLRKSDPEFHLQRFLSVFAEAVLNDDYQFFKRFGREVEDSETEDRSTEYSRIDYLLVEYWTNTKLDHPPLCFFTDEALRQLGSFHLKSSLTFDAVQKARQRTDLKKANFFFMVTKINRRGHATFSSRSPSLCEFASSIS